jgi:hypothetical protein
VQAILKLGGTGPKSASRLNFPLDNYSAADIEALALPGTAGHSSSKAQQRGKAGRAAAAKRQRTAAPTAGASNGSQEGSGAGEESDGEEV